MWCISASVYIDSIALTRLPNAIPCDCALLMGLWIIQNTLWLFICTGQIWFKWEFTLHVNEVAMADPAPDSLTKPVAWPVGFQTRRCGIALPARFHATPALKHAPDSPTWLHYQVLKQSHVLDPQASMKLQANECRPRITPVRHRPRCPLNVWHHPHLIEAVEESVRSICRGREMSPRPWREASSDRKHDRACSGPPDKQTPLTTTTTTSPSPSRLLMRRSVL